MSSRDLSTQISYLSIAAQNWQEGDTGQKNRLIYSKQDVLFAAINDECVREEAILYVGLLILKKIATGNDRKFLLQFIKALNSVILPIDTEFYEASVGDLINDARSYGIISKLDYESLKLHRDILCSAQSKNLYDRITSVVKARTAIIQKILTEDESDLILALIKLGVTSLDKNYSIATWYLSDTAVKENIIANVPYDEAQHLIGILQSLKDPDVEKLEDLQAVLVESEPIYVIPGKALVHFRRIPKGWQPSSC